MIDILEFTLERLTRTFDKDFGKGRFHAQALFRDIFKQGNLLKKMIRTYNKVIKGTETVQEVIEVVEYLIELITYTRISITEPTEDDSNRLWDFNFSKDYLQERHGLKLFMKPNVENLTLDQLKEELPIGSNPKDVLEKDPLWMEIKSQFN